jgi:hypothetical protein
LAAAALLVSVLSLAPACGSGSASSELECEKEGYPCSLADVPVEILERSNDLGDEAAARLEEGDSTEEVKAWLGEQPEMAEVGADEFVVRFRLEGGRGHWIFTRDSLATRTTIAAAAHASPPTRERGLAFVVGGESEQKRALVLSPVLWEFGRWDPGGRVSEILRGTRGYENGVTYLKNEYKASREVDIGSFGGWSEYQVIHVESHGNVLCDPPPCRAVIVARALSTPESAAAKLGQLPVTGVGVSVSPSGKYLHLDADFFRSQYEGGLEDTLVFFSSCKGFAATAPDLADAIRGATSVYLGWDGSVYANEANDATLALYDELSEGYAVEHAYSNLGGLRAASTASLILGERQAGGDLRIRDVVSLLDPSSGARLSSTDTIAIEGKARDGQPDAAPYLVQVDGMPAESAADVVLHVSVDGVEAEPQPLTSGQPKDDGQWLLRGVVPLGYDLEEDRSAVFRAWVELPSGGESDHETSATLTGDGPIMGTTWELVAENVYAARATIPISPWKSTARLTLSFAPGQDPTEPKPRYVVTGGTVRIDYSHTYYDCSITADPLTVDLSDPRWAGDSYLVFDTTVKPVRYGGVVATSSPRFEVLQTCGSSGSSSRTHVLPNVWFIIDSDELRPVPADKRKIVGTYDTGDGTITNRSTYTLTRIE